MINTTMMAMPWRHAQRRLFAPVAASSLGGGLSAPSRRRFLSGTTRKTPVLIVGGGPSGLFLANLLKRYGVGFRLLEAQPEEQHFRHPQAHFLNTRTMEILKHHTPAIHNHVVKAMRPSEEWNRFLFGASMRDPKPLAIVQHPVRSPLRAGACSNGVLLATRNAMDGDGDENHPGDGTGASTSGEWLSDCSVGHLAQHTFHRILYDEATKLGDENDDDAIIEFGSRVVGASRVSEDTPQASIPRRCWRVETCKGEMIEADVVVAADGARSAFREEYLGIRMSGQPTIQHLINVHFSLLPSKDLEDCLPPAMLYTVFSSEVLSMVVRHGPMDFVMQIPYFPPYQTLEEDFSAPKVEEMIHAALGNDHHDNSPNIRFKIESIRPWTMGSLVADSYAAKDAYLLGDAAHVFPPAGGFGMNTGLQDALALAWRLQSATQRADGCGTTYTRERRGVAMRNAALSVRNYHRVLGVMKSCYLDHNNLPILLKTLETSESLGIPLGWRKSTFHNLFRTALLPLQMLKQSPDSLYSSRVRNNLRKLLGSGQGLPLLFPDHEVGFRYPTRNQSSTGSKEAEDAMDWSQDSKASGSANRLIPGRLFPHLPVQLLEEEEGIERSATKLSYLTPGQSSMGAKFITTRDLPAQLATNERTCVFCLLQIDLLEENGSVPNPKHEEFSNQTDIIDLSVDLENLLGISVEPARLYVGELDAGQNPILVPADVSETVPSKPKPLAMFLERSLWEGTLYGEAHKSRSLVVLIRPDGHTSSISSNGNLEELAKNAKFELGLDTPELP